MTSAARSWVSGCSPQVRQSVPWGALHVSNERVNRTVFKPDPSSDLFTVDGIDLNQCLLGGLLSSRTAKGSRFARNQNSNTRPGRRSHGCSQDESLSRSVLSKKRLIYWRRWESGANQTLLRIKSGDLLSEQRATPPHRSSCFNASRNGGSAQALARPLLL